MGIEFSEIIGNRPKSRASQYAVATPAMIAGGVAIMLFSAYANAAVIQEPIGITAGSWTGDTIDDAAGVASSTSNQQGTSENGTGGVYKSSTGVILSDINDAGSGSYLGTGYVHNGLTFYQNGWNSGGATWLTGGIPANGTITSTSTGNQFIYGYNGTASVLTGNNTMYFTSSAAQTVTLATPITAQSLDFLAAGEISTNVATTHSEFDVTLHFADSTSDTYTQQVITGPLGDGGVNPSNHAFQVSGIDNGNSGGAKWSTGNFTESDITLSPADQAETIVSITFTPDPLFQSMYNTTNVPGSQFDPAGIYAISGAVVVPEPASIGLLTLASVGLLTRRRARNA